MQQYTPAPFSLTLICTWYCWSTSFQNSFSPLEVYCTVLSWLLPFCHHSAPSHSFLPRPTVGVAQSVKPPRFSPLSFLWSWNHSDCNLISTFICYPQILVHLLILSKWILLIKCSTNSLSSPQTSQETETGNPSKLLFPTLLFFSFYCSFIYSKANFAFIFESFFSLAFISQIRSFTNSHRSSFHLFFWAIHSHFIHMTTIPSNLIITTFFQLYSSCPPFTVILIHLPDFSFSNSMFSMSLPCIIVAK